MLMFLRDKLAQHPDRDLVEFILNGFTFGFDIGYCGSVTTGQSKNLQSARNNPQAVKESIQRELVRGHTSGPFDSPPYPVLHCSPLGAVPKKDNTYRLILDLSSPRGSSINAGISRSDYSVRYSSFDEAVNLVAQFSQQLLFSKVRYQTCLQTVPCSSRRLVFVGSFIQRAIFYRHSFAIRKSVISLSI